VERLRFLAGEQVTFLTWPGSRALKIEVYCDERTGRQLVRRFGGRVARLAPQVWAGEPARLRAPLAIRNRLKVFSDEPSWQAWRKAGRKPPGILVPAGMAFGTGEHATTVTCLRLLADLVAELPTGFRALDLGTGSGILAIGAEVLGAGEVTAIDYDAVAVRIARQNARKNRCRRLTVQEGDVLRLPRQKLHDLVMANLFSEVLIQAAPRVAAATRDGGWLIFSGVLKTQVAEVAATLTGQGFTAHRIVPRGKWCAGVCRRA
jgi:ribosomal protein L11 methyltransferase